MAVYRPYVGIAVALIVITALLIIAFVAAGAGPVGLEDVGSWRWSPDRLT